MDVGPEPNRNPIEDGALDADAIASIQDAIEEGAPEPDVADTVREAIDEGVPESDVADTIRDGLFQAASRTYAEQYVEPIIRAKWGLAEPTGGDHDALDGDGKRYEIKASKVLRTRDNRIGSRELLDRVLFEAEGTPLSRYFDSSRRYVENYDVNIQNVKRDHFEILIYVLLFKDCMMIFWANSSDIRKGYFSNWSDKHGRYDQEGKSGQFPISKLNIKWHEDRYLKYVMSYREVVRLLSNS